jgi:hypothetical protein
MDLRDRKIESIERGFGEESIYYSTSNKLVENSQYKVDEIKPYEKIIGKGYYNDITQLVYQCYKDGHVIAELDTLNLTIRYAEFGELA